MSWSGDSRTTSAPSKVASPYASCSAWSSMGSRKMLQSSSCPAFLTTIGPFERSVTPPHRGKRKRQLACLIVGLQQRLLSSTEAFARSLKVHRQTVKRHWEQESTTAVPESKTADEDARLFTTAPDVDHERGVWTDSQLAAEEDDQIESITSAAEAGAAREPGCGGPVEPGAGTAG